jgi:PAS domain S-box-containing protein
MNEVRLLPGWLKLVFLLAMVVLISVGYSLYRDQERSIKQESERQLEAIARLKVEQIVRWRTTRLNNALEVTEKSYFMDSVRRWLRSPNAHDEAYIRKRLDALMKIRRYQDVMLLDAAGHMKLDIMDPKGLLSTHTHVRQTLARSFQEKKPLISDFHSGPSTLGPHIDVVAPIFTAPEGAGEPLGAIVFRNDPNDFLYPLIQGWPIVSESAETLLVRRDGDDVLFLNELRHRKGTAFNLRIPLSQQDLPAAMVIQGTRGLVEGRDYRGVKVLAAVEPVPDSPWFIVAKEDKSEVFALWRIRSRLIILLLVGIMMTLFLIFLVLWQYNAKAYYRKLFDAQKSINESERKFRELFEHMQSAGAIYQAVDDGEDFIFIDFNPAAEKVEGVSRDEVLGRKVTEVFPGVKASGIFDLFKRVHTTGQGGLLVEAFYSDARDTGSWRRNAVFKLPSGNVVALYDDISERKHWETEREKLVIDLEKKNAEMERFTYTVSHDLKSPIITIKGFVAELEKSVASGDMETFTSDVRRISNAADRMKTMLDDVLKISRIGRVVGPFARIDVVGMLGEVKANLAGALNAQGVAIDVAQDLPPVFGDTYRLTELFQNLIENAIKFMGGQAEPRVEVGSFERDGERIFYVRDNGIGIDPKYAASIFELFNKLDAKGDGAGVGLSVVKRIVEVHGGKIWMESEGKGCGATFFFTIPGKEPEHEHQR